MLSRVPQGSVGGPTQFSLYIDDMADNVASRIIQFADDTKLWRIIRNVEDRDFLQAVMDTLKDWSDEWLLKFNAKKSKVLHIGPRKPKYNPKWKEEEQCLRKGSWKKI